MIIAKLTNQLGNQMFAYASVKSIALDKGFDFKYCRTPLEKGDCNDVDIKYGTELRNIFGSVPDSEYINYCDIPDDFSVYKERKMKDRFDHDYSQIVREEISDNTLLEGHFATSVFFADKVDLVRKWYTFPQDISAVVEGKIESLHEKLGADKLLVSVHFRCGNDYLKSGFKLGDKYWYDAVEYVKDFYEKQGKAIKIVTLFDKRTRAIDRFINKYDSLVQHGSMVEDMCFISKCDVNIVCNSTFSCMASILNPNCMMTVRPSRYPTEAGFFPDSIFMPKWVSIGDGKRSLISQLYYLKKRYWSNPIRRFAKKLIK